MNLEKILGFYGQLKKESVCLQSGVDCRLALFRLLLLNYGYGNFSFEQILIISEAFDLNLEKFTLSGVELYQIEGRVLTVEEKFCNNFGIPYQAGHFDSISELINFAKKQGFPILLAVDRFYLEYLNIKKAHYGYHVVLLLNIDVRSNTALILDFLDDKVQNVTLDCLSSTLFADIPYAKPRGYYFMITSEASNKIIVSDQKLITHWEYNIEDLIKRNVYGIFYSYIQYLRSLLDSYDEVRFRYLLYVAKLNISSVYTLDPSKTFYRMLFANGLIKINKVNNFIVHKSINAISKSATIWKEISLLNNQLANSRQIIEKLIDLYEEIYKVESSIIHYF